MKQAWYPVLLVAGLVAVMAPMIVLASSGGVGRIFHSGEGFDAVVSGIEIRYHAHATKVPMMGFVSAIAGIATHGGVRNMHVAEFEQVTGPVDGTELTELVEKRAGQGWRRMVRETSRASDGSHPSQSLIYVRDENNHVGMLVVDLDGHELDIVQMSVNPDQLARELAKHHHEHDGSQDKGDSANASKDDAHHDSDTE
jgi:hypothetical protein